ncbi:MAG: ABC transporter substrate-binding protein [Dehalococcoidia bacterium]
MSRKVGLWYKLAALFLVLALVVPILAACGDDDEEETATPSATTPAATTPAKTTPVAQSTVAPTAATPVLTPTKTVSKEPVKIGLLMSWSGPLAMAGTYCDQDVKIIEQQVDDWGGILGGRSVKFIKFDDKSEVANTVAGYKKLVMESNVCAVAPGGANASALTAASDAAEETHVPLFSIGSTPEDLSNRPYTIRCVYPNASTMGKTAVDFILNNLKPKTVGFLVGDLKETRDRTSMMKKLLEEGGIKTVYEQYIAQGTTDFAPFLTRIKYENPDVLISDSGGNASWYAAIFKQIPGLGGWGNMKFVSNSIASSGANVLKEAGAEGTYHVALWIPGMNYPGAKEFERYFANVLPGTVPSSSYITQYYALRTLIEAIKLAGSDDPIKIAQAARSGNLSWEAPGGTLRINPDGTHSVTGQMFVYKSGKLVSPD